MKNHISVAHMVIVIVTIFIGAFYGCEIQEDFEYEKSNSGGKLQVNAWQYIQNNDSLELMEKAIKLTNLQGLYQDGSVQTFIAPTNSAFKEYLQTNSYEMLEDVPLPILRNLIKYHIVNDRVIFTDPDLFESNKPIAYQTANGQIMFLSHNTNFIGLINQGTSKQWQISISNLEPLDDVMHVVNSVVYFSAPSGDLNVPDPSIKKDTIFPVHDTYINGGTQSSVNFGSNVILKVKNVTGNGNFDRKSYLMFDLKDFDEEGIITDLKLEMSVKFTAAKGVDLDLYSVQDTLWTEMGLTFDNATFPQNNPIASLTTSKIDKFDFDITDFFNALGERQKVSLVLDGQAGSDETDEFASKENTDFDSPMLIATLASGNNSLVLVTNTGFTLEKGGAFVWNNTMLELTGAPSGDIIFIVEETPQHGWLIQGANILKAGDRFTQSDIDLMNLVYINDETGTTDKMVLSAKDRAGSGLAPFEVMVTIQ